MKMLPLIVVLLIQAGGQIRLQTGIVRGEIRGFDGQPAVGVRVSAVPDRTGDAQTGLDTMVVLSQTDASGRYTLEGIPPGRYVITAGLIDAPTYYPGVNSLAGARVVSVTTAGTTRGIDFTLALSPGVRVRGIVKSYPAGAPAGLLRVMLTGTSAPRGRIPEAPVSPDGTFEFPRVPPGVYDIRMGVPVATGASTRIEVQNKDIDSVTLDLGVLLLGRLAVDDGSPLPQRRALALAGIPDLPASVRMNAQPVNVNRTGGVVTPVRASDGIFLAMLPEGEYRIAAIVLPLGYDVRAMVRGSADLLQSPLKVTSDLASRPEEIRVTLTRTPPKDGPAWRTISGRVFGVPAGSAAQYMVVAENAALPTFSPTGVKMQRMGEVSVRDDGTFEIPNVPPDSYSLRAMNPTSGGMPSVTVGITVGDANVTGVELLAPEPRVTPSNSVPPPQPPQSTGGILNLFQQGTLPSTEPAGVKVSGSVVLASINDRALMPHTAVLFGAKSGGRTLHTPIAPNGVFEFPNVPPGEYDMRTLPQTFPNESTRVLVERQELQALRVALPAQSNLQGRVRMEEGRSLPDLTGTTLKLVSPLMEINLPLGTDGVFAARVAHGEYKVEAANVPRGFAVTPSTINVNAPGTADITIGLRGVTP
jgi:hypothetical protein